MLQRLILILILFMEITPVHANPLLGGFVRDYLLGKALDGIIDTVTGKPEVFELDKRIIGLEQKVGHEYSQPLIQLRENTVSGMTIQQYYALVFKTLEDLEKVVAENSHQINQLKERVSILEDQTYRVQGNSLISKFVIAYFENSQSEDVSYFFADRVDFYSKGTVSRNTIRQESVKYEKKWPSRTYKVVGSPHIEKVGSMYIVNTILRFAVANYKRAITGRSDNILKIKMFNGSPKIVSVRETVTRD